MADKVKWRARWTFFKTAILALIWTALLGWLLPQSMLVSRFDWHPWMLGPVRLLAWLPIFFGAVMCFTSLWNFATVGEGTPAPFDPPRRLVTRGFYRFVRNPIYIGAFLITFGEALLLNALSLRLLAWIAAISLAVHLLVVLYEERILHAKFGAEYEDYLRRVPRWIPNLK